MFCMYCKKEHKLGENLKYCNSCEKQIILDGDDRILGFKSMWHPSDMVRYTELLMGVHLPERVAFGCGDIVFEYKEHESAKLSLNSSFNALQIFHGQELQLNANSTTHLVDVYAYKELIGTAGELYNKKSTLYKHVRSRAPYCAFAVLANNAEPYLYVALYKEAEDDSRKDDED